MLDLETRVHLEEEELARCVVQQELHRACVDVADLSGERHGGGGDAVALLGSDRRCGCLLEHLLVTALRGAVALEEVQHVSVVVADDLDLHVTAGLDVLLHEHGVVAEGRGRLAPRRRQRLGVLLLAAHDAHALAAATGGGLDQDGVVEPGRLGVGVVRRHHGDPRLLRDLAGGVLAAHLLHHRGARADQGEAGLLHGVRKGRPLGEEAVAGVDRLGPALEGSGDHGADVEVGRHLDGLVGLPDVRRGAVEVGVHGDRVDAEGTGRADDAAGDLATVGDQEALDHHILQTP